MGIIGELQDIIRQELRELPFPQTDIQKELLRACITDIFALDLRSRQTGNKVALQSRVRIDPIDTSVNEYLINYQDTAQEEGIRLLAERIKQLILKKSTTISFTVSDFDTEGGYRKKFTSWHEPENRPVNVNATIDRVLPIPAGLVLGYAAGYLSTEVAGTWLAKYQELFPHIQGIIWGISGAAGSAPGIYYAYKNPRKYNRRTRNILGTELITRDRAALSQEEGDMQPKPGNYTGKRVAYSVGSGLNISSLMRGREINLMEWHAQNGNKPLFKVTSGAWYPVDTVWVVDLELRFGRERLTLHTVKGFHPNGRTLNEVTSKTEVVYQK